MRLLSIRPLKTTPHDAKAAPAAGASSTGGPAASGTFDAQRLIVEICCHPKSKLSNTSRKSSEDCTVLQFTEEFDLNDEDNRADMATQVHKHKGDPPMFWVSLPCTGGTTWTFINMKHPKARLKVLRRIKEFKELWKSFEAFLNLINVKFFIALEWTKRGVGIGSYLWFKGCSIGMG